MLLLNAGAPVNGGPVEGRQALEMAVQHNRFAIVQLLLGRGADPNQRAYQHVLPILGPSVSWTPLMVAAAYGHADIAEELIRAGADVNARRFGLRGFQTALRLAKQHARPAVIEVLQRSGARR